MSELRLWQSEALAAWEENGRRGIIAAATGTGKTRLALEALRRTAAEGARAIVVVPTRTLQEQWLRELRTSRVVPVSRIGTIGGPAPAPNPDDLLTVAVIDSARSGSRALMSHWNMMGFPTMLVVDECHWAGSDYNRAVFEGGARWRLGLSATPERGDDGFDDVLVPELGGIVYRYSLKHAMDDGVLADLRLVNLLIDLPANEQREYRLLEQRIERVRASLTLRSPMIFEHADWAQTIAVSAKTDAMARRLSVLLGERRRLLMQSMGRFAVIKSLVKAGEFVGRRTIVFNETIEQAEHVIELLRSSGLSTVADHSRMSQRDRTASQARFRSLGAECLVVVRAADEGLDVPDADQAVITSGTLNPRQRIQRLGRIVRKGGLPPRALSILASGTSEEFLVAGRDLELLGRSRVRSIRVSSCALPPLWRD